jgi:hypothetical protein
MAAKTLTVGGIVFPTYGAGRTYIRERIAKLKVYDQVLDRDLDAVLRDLVERRPDSAPHIRGPGISHFRVGSDGVNKNFYAVRVDGTERAFSWPKSIVMIGGGDDHADRALRLAVKIDIDRARDRFKRTYLEPDGCAPCGITGQMTPISSMVVDHIPPWSFHDLKIMFLDYKCIEENDIPTWRHPSRQHEIHMSDTVLEREWRKFHAEAAILDMVRRDLNGRQGNGHNGRALDRIWKPRIHISLED